MARPRLTLAAGAALVCLVPLAVTSEYYMRVTNVALVYALLALSLNVVLGYAGQLALGHAGFFGIGAYASALLTLDAGLPFWGGLAGAGLSAGTAGVVLGIPALRLKGHYLALATLGFGEIMRHIFFNWQAVTRGMDGIGGLQPPSLYSWTISSDRAFFYLLLAFVLATMVFSYRLEHSKFGRAFMAIRDAEVAAGAVGINVTRGKVLAFALSAAIAGLAGSLYAHLMTYISPDVFVFDVSATVLAMLLVGGAGSAGGVVFGAALLTYLPEWLRFSKTYYMLIYGAGMVAIVVFMPGGAASLIGPAWRGFRVAGRAALRPDTGGRAAAATTPPLPRPRVEPGPLLEIRGLTKRFGGLTAVDAFEMTVEARQIHALIGPNGSGKSTILNLVSGIYRPDAGSICFAGKTLVGLNPWDVVGAGIARTFQNIRLFPGMTVWQNVMAARYLRSEARLLPVLLGLPRASREEAAIRDHAAQIVQFVGLGHRLDSPAGSLPHEEQRLVEIARALATDPTLLMLDEPAAGMNPAETERLMERILRLRELGLTILLIEHNVQLVMKLADRVSVIDFGRLIAAGSPLSVQNDPRVVEAYLGSETLSGGA